jgi:hypothetical protein
MSRDEVIAILRQMIETADNRGHYVLDGNGARVLEAAIEMLARAYPEQTQKP